MLMTMATLRMPGMATSGKGSESRTVTSGTLPLVFKSNSSYNKTAIAIA